MSLVSHKLLCASALALTLFFSAGVKAGESCQGANHECSCNHQGHQAKAGKVRAKGKKEANRKIASEDPDSAYCEREREKCSSRCNHEAGKDDAKWDECFKKCADQCAK